MPDELMIPYAIDRSSAARYIVEPEFLNQDTRAKCRVRAFQGHARAERPVFCCIACSGHLFPRLSSKQRPHWAHIADENSKLCPLATNRTLSRRHLDAILYGGRKEGRAHKSLIEAIVGMAELDSRITRESISKGSYIRPERPGEPGRYPDIQFQSDLGRIVVEVQLSPITLHRLVDRAEFYRRENALLLWVTRAFDPRSIAATWLADIWASQEQAIFSVDDDLILQAHRARKLLFRRHDIGGGESRVVELAEIARVPWHTSFKQRWREIADPYWYQARPLVAELLSVERLPDEHDTDAIAHALNTLFTVEAWDVMGSRHSNPISVVHSFLESSDGPLGARLIELALERYRPEALNRPTTRTLIDQAKARAYQKQVSPWGRRSAIAILRTKLFPDWLIDGSPERTPALSTRPIKKG